MLDDPFFRHVVASMSDAVVIADTHGIIRYVNAAFEALTGVDPDEVRGRPTSVLPSRDTSALEHAAVWEAVRSGRTWRGRMKVRRRPQATGPLLPIAGRDRPAEDAVWVSMTVSPVYGSERELLGYVTIQRDISDTVARERRERVAREDALVRALVSRTLQKQSPLKDRFEEAIGHLFQLDGLGLQKKGGVFLLNEEKRELELYALRGEFSDEFVELEQRIPFGYCLCGRAAVSGELLVSDDCFCDPRHERQFENMTPHGHYIVPLRYDGKTYGILFLYSDPYPLRDAARIEQLSLVGELMGLAIANDRLFQALEEARDKAYESARAKSRFLANMSHEIRTPLNGILGFTKMLMDYHDSTPEEERRSQLETIHRSGEHLLAIINDILDVSKIESGRMKLEKKRFSLDTLLQDVEKLMRLKAEEKGIGLEFSWEGPRVQSIESDPTRLRQILINLVGNAIKFTDEGKVSVTGRLEESEERPVIRFDVSDTGIGIEPDKLDGIFNAFVQADTSVTRRFGGTGLGLTISRRLAEMMGGSLTVASEPGKGSTFTFWIAPSALVLADSASDAAPAGDADGDVAEETNRKPDPLRPGLRVLVVEDVPVNQKLVLAFLAEMGVDQVVTVDNGAVGVERAQAESFDIILMDMQMPVMDGYEATRTLRALGIQTPIIAMTAHALSGDAQKCLDAGCDDYIAKPIDMDLLWRKLAQWQDAASREDGARPETPDGQTHPVETVSS